MEDGGLLRTRLRKLLPPAPAPSARTVSPYANRALLSDLCLLALPEPKQAALGAGFQVGW